MFFVLLVFEQLTVQNRLSKIYSFLILVAFIYSFIQSIAYLTSIKTLQFGFSAFGIFFITILFSTWFIFICYYKNYDSLTNIKVFILLTIVPLIYLIAAISNPITHILLNPAGEISGSAFTLITHHAYIYSLVLCLIAAILLLKRRNKKLHYIFSLMLAFYPILMIFLNLILNIILDLETMPILLLIFLGGGVYGLSRSKVLNLIKLSQEFFINNLNVDVV